MNGRTRRVSGRGVVVERMCVRVRVGIGEMGVSGYRYFEVRGVRVGEEGASAGGFGYFLSS